MYELSTLTFVVMPVQPFRDLYLKPHIVRQNIAALYQLVNEVTCCSFDLQDVQFSLYDFLKTKPHESLVRLASLYG